MPEYNYTAAFVEFSKGAKLEDISLALAIPLDSLLRHYQRDRWALLASQTAVALTLPPAEGEAALARMKANREKNLAIAKSLQEDLVEVVAKLRDGTLTIEKSYANGTTATVTPGIRERAELAQYAKSVAELSYRALGDQLASRDTSGEPGVAGGMNLTIMLPPQVATPREKRAYDIESEVVVQEPAALGG